MGLSSTHMHTSSASLLTSGMRARPACISLCSCSPPSSHRSTPSSSSSCRPTRPSSHPLSSPSSPRRLEASWCAHAHACTCACTCMHMRMHMHAHAQLAAPLGGTCSRTHEHTCTRACTPARTRACTRAYTCSGLNDELLRYQGLAWPYLATDVDAGRLGSAEAGGAASVQADGHASYARVACMRRVHAHAPRALDPLRDRSPSLPSLPADCRPAGTSTC